MRGARGCTGREGGAGLTATRTGKKKKLSLWNHGMGWAGFGGDGDNYDGWMMELDPMVQGIKAGLEQSQARGGPGKLDILARQRNSITHKQELPFFRAVF